MTGSIFFLMTLTSSNGAPQEAAGSAMSLCFVIIPYCFSRAADSIIKIIVEKRDLKNKQPLPLI